MDVAKVEKIEGDLNALIERRAKQNEKANAEEMVWKASVRKYHAKLSTSNLTLKLHGP